MPSRDAGSPCVRRASATRAAHLVPLLALAAVLVWTVPGSAQGAKKQLALAEVTNGSYYRGPDIADAARTALLTALMDSANTVVVEQAKVDEKIRELGLESPLSDSELRQLGEALGCDVVVSGRVLACSINDYSHTASARLRVGIYDAGAQASIRTTMVKGTGRSDNARATDRDLVAASLKDAAYQAVQEIGQNLCIAATLLSAASEDRVLVSLPEGSGAKVGTELAVYRGTTEVARLIVYKVTPGHSVCKLKTKTPLSQLQAGLRVLVVSTPSASLDEKDVKPKKKHHSSALKVAAAVLIGAAVVYAVVRAVQNRVSSSSIRGQFLRPADGSTIEGGDAVPVEVAFTRADGTAVADNSEVEFSLSQASVVTTAQTPFLGSILSPIKTTAGVASTTFTPGDTGTAVRLTARLGGTTISRDVIIGSGTPASLTLTVPADQRVIQANGRTSAQVTAEVTDSSGALVSGVVVTFSTTGGTLSAQRVATTDGRATTLLSSTTAAGPVTVTAAVEGDAAITDQVVVDFVAGDPAGLTFNPATINLAPGGQAAVTVTVTDSAANLVPDGTQVTLAVNPATAGVLGTSRGMGAAQITLATTAGRVSTIFFAGNTPVANANIVVTAAPATGQLPVTVAPTEASDMQLGLSPLQGVPADGTSTYTVVAQVLDINGAAVADGTPISFTLTPGTATQARINSNQTTVQGGSAQCTVVSSTAGTATVTARVPAVGGGNLTRNIVLTFDALPASRIQLAAAQNPVAIADDGMAATTVTAVVTDSAGRLVADGTAVAFTTTLGTVSPAQTMTTNGSVTVQFSSIVTGTAAIEATSGSATPGRLSITVNPGPAAAVVLSADPLAIRADGNSFSTITAQVVDRSGNTVVDGTLVHFTALLYRADGVIEDTTITASARTVGGTATAILVSRIPGGTLTPNAPGTARVTVTVPEDQPNPIADLSYPVANATTEVEYVSQVAASIALGVDPYNVRGLDIVGRETTVTALVRDSSNNPVPDNTAVYFTATHGMIRGSRGTTNGVAESYTVNGIAQAVLLTAGENPPGWDGFVDISVSSGPITQNFIRACIFSGPAVDAYSSVVLDGVEGGGPGVILPNLQGNLTIEVRAFDEHNNPVEDGTSIRLEANRGKLDASVLTTVGGVATTTVRTPAEPPAAAATGPGGGRLSAFIDRLILAALREDASFTVP